MCSSTIIPMYNDDQHQDQNFEKSTGKRLKRCLACGLWFYTNRYHAQTGSAKCRKAYSRGKRHTLAIGEV